ncbi:hypothetical protein PPL_02265 [Heterostelium album PN500]|uniref:MRH domain-containing protein n=1 Tax=Heterostelium pallidum (strain ATCC 26659 / Pp 5 / PN500) TaxID=670386 RepID=D3B1U1_HETP5|nr:hypothetical protein PPL_02265 [Heterostelium album PN500]EFA85265.1 hypothetical protein PPL_02265 [Heterostelium album PN500]|eukprot:XP_020437374.1 hypothetical protein PPL_02265 [Heterostelium album PN500]
MNNSFIFFLLLLLIVDVKTQNCAFYNVDTQKLYNFNALTGQYFGSYQGYNYYFNICGTSTQCANSGLTDSAVCLTSSSGNSGYISAGRVDHLKVLPLDGFQGGKIEYSDGLWCYDVPSINRTTTIEMYCAFGQDTIIDRVYAKSTCNYVISISNTLMKTLKVVFVIYIITTYISIINGNSCAFYDTSTGKLYNFNALSGQYFKTVQGYDYFFNICGYATHCVNNGNPGAACCQNPSPPRPNSYTSCGQLNQISFLPLDDGGEGGVIKYSGGLWCYAVPNINRSLTIQLNCKRDQETTITRLYQKSTCVYVVEITSKYACPVDIRYGF